MNRCDPYSPIKPRNFSVARRPISGRVRPQKIMSPSVDARPFHMWRLAELKAECRKYGTVIIRLHCECSVLFLIGLKVGGKKAELIQRLSAAPATSSTNTKSKRKVNEKEWHVIMLRISRYFMTTQNEVCDRNQTKTRRN